MDPAHFTSSAEIMSLEDMLQIAGLGPGRGEQGAPAPLEPQPQPRAIKPKRRGLQRGRGTTLKTTSTTWFPASRIC
eukprot:3726423-Karenia_brevis.AAC.1